MPTPFSHLRIAQWLLHDEQLPTAYREILSAERGAFLLGSVAADARVGAGTPREKTHFYVYGQEIVESPWRVMLAEYPALWHPATPAHTAFVAGYVAHLAVDELWSKQMVGPQFVQREWRDRFFRFYMLHIILIYMDERDLAALDPWQPSSLYAAQPDHWLPFLSDGDLRTWRDLIYDQIKQEGRSQTLEIFGERIMKSPGELRAFLDSEAEMQTGLWDNIPKTYLDTVEAAMYDYSRQQLCTYLDTQTTSESSGLV